MLMEKKNLSKIGPGTAASRRAPPWCSRTRSGLALQLALGVDGVEDVNVDQGARLVRVAVRLLDNET